MNDRAREVFSDEELSVWIRRHPEVWRYAEVPVQAPDTAQVESLIDSILSGEHQRRRQTQARRRRKIVLGGCVGAVVLGSAVGVAAIIAARQPTVPEAGAVCRATAAIDADAVVLATGVDPISGCGEQWAKGLLGDNDELVPPLAACVSADGVVNVFPGQPEVCGSLGLAPVQPALSPGNDAIVVLQASLDSTINLAKCRPAADVVVAAEQILDQSDVNGWKVVVTPGAETGQCGKAGLDSATKTVTIFDFPGGTP